MLGNVVMFGSVNANKRHYELGAEALASADRNWLSRLITRRVPLARWHEAFESRPDDIKVVLAIRRGSMSAPIESYGMIGDCKTAALVGLRRLDRLAVLAALRFRRLLRQAAGRPEQRLLADHAVRRDQVDAPLLPARHADPRDDVRDRRAARRPLIDFMLPHGASSDLIRIVRGDEGEVAMCMELMLRFGYGATTPWVTRLKDGTMRAVAGPDMVVMRTPANFRGENFKTVAQFTLTKGKTMPFVLSYQPSHLAAARRRSIPTTP